MVLKTVEKWGHCNTCDCDFTFLKGLEPHKEHNTYVIREFKIDVPEGLKDEVFTY